MAIKLYKRNATYLKGVCIAVILLFCFALVYTVNGNVEATQRQEAQIDDTTYFQDFSLSGLNGEQFTSEDVAEHKLTIVNAWAPWCGPCVGEMPDLETLYEGLDNDEIMLVGVVADYTTTEEANYDSQIEDKVASTGVEYPIMVADQKFTDEMLPLTGGGIPCTWAIDQDGKIIGMISGSRDLETWQTQVDEWLKEVS